MRNELADRQKAIQLHLAGESVESICRLVRRSRAWFHKWWQRYLTAGPEGLYDLTRANHQVFRRTPPHVERTILSIRRRLAARATPETRYSLVGAAAIRDELQQLGYRPVPSLRTIERIVQRAGLTCPPLRLARRVAQTPYPGPQAHDSNQVHQVDMVGPRYLKGDRTRYYFWLAKDRFDQAIYVELSTNRRMDTVLAFLVRAWQALGLPAQVQFDNAREFCGWGRRARWLSRVIRLCLRLGVEPVFIPEGKPQRNGSIENFNGWFQPLLLGRRLRRAADRRRELRRLMTATNEQHVHPQLGYRTPARYRRGKRLRKLPARFVVDGHDRSLAAGKVTFIRLVSAHGTIPILGESFKVGKRFKFQYVKATLDTQRQGMTIYHNGRVLSRFAWKLGKK